MADAFSKFVKRAGPLPGSLYPSERSSVAHHEAAHAVVGQFYGKTVYSVSIQPDAHTRGRCAFSPTAESRLHLSQPYCPWPRGSWRRREYIWPEPSSTDLDRAKVEAQVFLAGPLLQAMVDGKPPRWGTDRRGACVAVSIFTGWGWHQIHRYLRAQEIETKALLQRPEIRRDIDALAARLVVEETIGDIATSFVA